MGSISDRKRTPAGEVADGFIAHPFHTRESLRTECAVRARARRATLDCHGWGDLHLELNRLSKQGRWDAMTTS